MNRQLLLVVALWGAGTVYAAEPKVVEGRKIWDQAPHNAFTDLVRFQDRWFCVFREGKGHVSPDGALRVITSADGEKWESAAVITSPNSDLRDAKINITPSGQLMLCGAEAVHDKSQKTHQSLAWFSKDGRAWSDKVEIGEPDYWLWRATWHKGTAYGIGYACKPGAEGVRLYKSADGRAFQPVVKDKDLFAGQEGNETSIVFLPDDSAVCLLRRDVGGGTAQVGVAKPPYTKWEWKDLGMHIGGPHLLRLPDGRLIGAGRILKPKVHTGLLWIDPVAGKAEEFVTFPSSGDTSYPGLVLHDGVLWVSYYSSHEGKTNIYLAKVAIPPPATGAGANGAATSADEVRQIGSRLELFIDHYLIDRLTGTQLKLHEPQLAPPMTEPADNLEYGTVIKDGDLYRLYTRDGRGAKVDGDQGEVTRYCESRDGIHWTRPKLGLHEVDGSKENNVILHEPPYCHNFSPLLDARPGVPPEERFKALAGLMQSGLIAFISADGIHWRKLRLEPVIPNRAKFRFSHLFDSQNLAFWSEAEGCYVCYFRVWDGVRRIARTTSSDFLIWSEPKLLATNFPGEHLYTSQTHPYFRAPHIYVALPSRFHQERGESTDILFMTARGDTQFDRTFRDAFIRPGLDPARWGNRSNYAALGVVPTGPAEMSIYTTPFRRFVLRTDGFASVHAGADVSEMLTRPLSFIGKELILNYATSAGGKLQVEIQDAGGKPLPGFALADCRTLVGDSIEQKATWKQGSDVASLAGQAVRLRFVMQEADLYSLRFAQ